MAGLSERLKHVKEYSERLQNLKMETAMQAVDSFMQTDQYKMAVMSMPDDKTAVTALVEATVKAVTDPSSDFVDTLRAKGFRSGEIRTLVHRLYGAYCKTLDTDTGTEQELLYEDMLPRVAEYVMLHQEVYSTLSVDDLRSEGK